MSENLLGGSHGHSASRISTQTSTVRTQLWACTFQGKRVDRWQWHHLPEVLLCFQGTCACISPLTLLTMLPKAQKQHHLHLKKSCGFGSEAVFLGTYSKNMRGAGIRAQKTGSQVSIFSCAQSSQGHHQNSRLPWAVELS